MQPKGIALDESYVCKISATQYQYAGRVVNAIMDGEIIEDYPDDYPYPSCLIIGYTVSNKIIHVVCGIGEGEVWLITAYYPDKARWSEDFKTRKES